MSSSKNDFNVACGRGVTERALAANRDDKLKKSVSQSDYTMSVRGN